MPCAVSGARRIISDLLSLEQERQMLEEELINLLSGNRDPAREAELRAARR
jgi:hypothetical protein